MGATSFHLSVGVVPPSIELYQTRKTEDLYFKNDKILWQKQTAIFWGVNDQGNLTEDLVNKLSLQRGICIFRRKENYVDVYYIASTKNTTSNIYDLYLNNPQTIFRLIDFFQEAIAPKLPLAHKDFFLPYMDGCRLKLPGISHDSSTKDLQDFYAATNLKKYSLDNESQKFSLSLRELQCLHLIAHGYTSKDIANELGLSYRTVEHYLVNIRNKVECTDKTELIKVYRQNDIARWFQV